MWLRKRNWPWNGCLLWLKGVIESGLENHWLDHINAQQVLEASASGVVIVDMQQRIVYANTRMEKLFGYTPDELLGQSLSLLLPERFSSRHAEHVATYFQTPRQRPMGIGLELFGRRKDGTEFPVEVSLSYLLDPIPLAIAMINDITRRHELEEELKRNNTELNAFAHTVAHDLKNPLTLVLGYAEYLQENLSDLSPLDVIDALERIRQNSIKMRHIIDELLLLASARREDVKLGALTMSEVLHEALQRLNEAIRRSGKTLILPENLPSAYGYAPWVEEVWVNYLSNALKYGGQEIVLGATPLGQDRIRYWIWDSGPGLTPEQQARLFQEYQRLERVGEGSGLGLSIVKRLVERMGGTVDVISAPGMGTSFGFTLAAATGAEISAAAVSFPE